MINPLNEFLYYQISLHVAILVLIEFNMRLFQVDKENAKCILEQMIMERE
jgi:hypothetical protein